MIKRKKTHCQRLYQEGSLQIEDTVYVISTYDGIDPGCAMLGEEHYRTLEFMPKNTPWDTEKYPLLFKSQMLDLLADGMYDELAPYLPAIDISQDNNELDDILRDAIELTIDWVPVVAVWIGEKN